MLEIKFEQAAILKKLLDAIKDLVTDSNFDCGEDGITLQAMDSSHVSLVSMHIKSDGLAHYRCDSKLTLGINVASMTKILKCADNDDICILNANDDSDNLSFTFESAKSDKVSKFEMKLMDIDSERLTIPRQEHKATVKMPANEFQRICRDLSSIGESVKISVGKEGITFEASGESGSGFITLRQNTSVDDEKDQVTIDVQEPVKLTFALRYLNFFTKATSLADSVTLSMNPDVPLEVEYVIGDLGYVRYYLAPKIEEFEDES